MPTEKITIDLLVGDNETMRVEAYKTAADGLVVHRQVAYVPAKEEHKFTSKWQITQASTGMALLKPSQCLSTKSEADRVAAALSEHDWSETLSRDSKAHKDMLEALATVEPDEGDEAPTDVRRYVVRRNQSGPGYVVWDTEHDTETEQHMHRGLAGEAARSLNEKVST